MQEWSFIVLGLVTVAFVVLVFRRLPWPRTRSIRIENRWIGSTSIEFGPTAPELPAHASSRRGQKTPRASPRTAARRARRASPRKRKRRGR